MPSKRSGYIATLVPKIHEVLNIDLTVPVDAKRIAEQLGGIVRTASSEEIPHEACIRKAGESFEILLKPGYPTRERFSIAHELGHLFLHMGYLVDADRFSSLQEGQPGYSYDRVPSYHLGKSEEEYEANEFASELLMPRQQFMEAVRANTTGGTCNIEALADRFGVSRQAAATRGRWLGVFEWE